MSQAAKLGADDFVLTDLGRGEVQRNIQPGNKILLHPQLPHIKGMSHILRMHEEVDFLVHRDRHLGRHDVVPRIHIMLGVETKDILRSFVDQLGMKGAKLSVRTGIAEIESELSGLDLDRHGIGRRAA